MPQQQYLPRLLTMPDNDKLQQQVVNARWAVQTDRAANRRAESRNNKRAGNSTSPLWRACDASDLVSSAKSPGRQSPSPKAQSPSSPQTNNSGEPRSRPLSPDGIETINLPDPTEEVDKHPDSPPPVPRDSDESDDDVLDDEDDHLMTVEQELLGQPMDVGLVELLLGSSPGLRNDPDYARIGSRVCRGALARLQAESTPPHEVPAIVGVMGCLWNGQQSAGAPHLTAEEHSAAVAAVLKAAAEQPALLRRAFACCWRVALSSGGQEMLREVVITAAGAVNAAPEPVETPRSDCRAMHAEAATVLWNACVGHAANAAAARSAGAVDGLVAIQKQMLEEWGRNLTRTDTTKLAAGT